MHLLFNLASFIVAFMFMECFAWFMHRYVMHGIGWFLHRSHHSQRKGFFELNDFYALIFAIPAIAMMYFGRYDYGWMFWFGAGISAYGIGYFVFHDVIVHRRLKHSYVASGRYMKRIIRAHKIHHKSLEKENGQSFGFLFAPRKYDVRSKDD